MRALMFVGGGILIGVGVSWAEATRSAEMRANKRIEEEMESITRVDMMLRRQRIESEAPAKTEEDLTDVLVDKAKSGWVDPDGVDLSPDAITVGGEMVQETSYRETALSDVTPSKEYLQTAHEYWDPGATSVEVRMEYMTSDEFIEDDGRAKEQILIHMGGDGVPLFINEGVMLVDWAEIIPNTILADMYAKCPPGEDKVLYVRNHANDTDYEVIQEIP